MSTIRFTKMQGAGNDYIYVNADRYPIENPSEAARTLSDRHKGIGGDGLVLFGKSRESGSDFYMRIFNADGSEALMCGNAARCVGRYLYEKGLAADPAVRLDTRSGVKKLSVRLQAGRPVGVNVDMLVPSFADPALFNEADDPGFGHFVSMGNPHYVIFADSIDSVEMRGPVLERHAAFPQRCNIEFARQDGPSEFTVRVWERGSGITQACGTGACAVAAAAFKTGRAPRQCTVNMDGGTLFLEWRESDSHMILGGPAEIVFEGEFYIKNK